jgi:hypothetical protein
MVQVDMSIKTKNLQVNSPTSGSISFVVLVTVLDGTVTVASGGTPAGLLNAGSCKTPRVAPIMVTDGRTESQKFRLLLRKVRQARECSLARRVAVE